MRSRHSCRPFSTVAVLVCLFLFLSTPQAYASDERVIYLAFNEPSPQRVVVCAFGIVVPPTFDNTVVSTFQPYTDQEIATIVSNLESMFAEAGVNNITFTTSRPDKPAVTVHYQGTRENCLFGEAIDGIDQFDRVRQGERVVIFGDVFADTLQNRARVTAHELGHTFGLRHVAFQTSIDMRRESIMDDRQSGSCGAAGCRDRFVNFAWDVDNLFVPERSNPVYHLRRWVAGEGDAMLRDAGICPGIAWDLPFSERSDVLLTLSLGFTPGGPGQKVAAAKDALPDVLYDVKLVRDDGDHVPTILDFRDELSTAETATFTAQLKAGERYLLFASTVDNEAPDIVLTTIGAEPGDVDFLTASFDAPGLSLQRLEADDTLLPIAEATTVVLPTDIFRGDFEADDELGKSLVDVLGISMLSAVEDYPPCAKIRGYDDVGSFLARIKAQFQSIENFDSFTPGQRLSSIFNGSVTFSGWSEDPSVFFGAWQLFGPGGGPIEGGALLPEPSIGPKVPFTFNFNPPVGAFGADFYDDGPRANFITLRAVTVDGDVLEISEDSDQSGWVGFLGFTSRVGIKSVTMINGIPIAGPIEVDNIRIQRFVTP